MRILMTEFIKKSELNNDWYIIDGKNAVVGRLASIIAKIIRGKHKTTFTPHMDHGDFVVVKNIENIKFTGKKFENKKYYRHSGHPGGIKETTPKYPIYKAATNFRYQKRSGWFCNNKLRPVTDSAT